MKELLVTVFIITYKKFDTIYRTINSALNQDYAQIELIVSDDGSPSFPKQAITAYIEQKKQSNILQFRVIDNQENVGTVRHINNILKEAAGHIYIPLAGDDCFFDRTVVSRIVEKYRANKFNVLSTSRICKKNDCLFFMPHYRSRRRIDKLMRTAKQQRKRFTECREMDFASGSSMAYEASFLREMGYFDEKYVLWEDGPFINKMTRLGYPITTAYDIISIQYDGNGISSVGNPIINKDVELFNATDRRDGSENFGWYHKRALDYIERKFKPMTTIQRYWNRLVYLDVFIGRLFYLAYENYARSKDAEYIKQFSYSATDYEHRL